MHCVIAYEPLWAIGTGNTATSAQAQEVCASIRATLGKLYDLETAKTISILYGGSMNAGNAAELLAQPDVFGGLIGGLSWVLAGCLWCVTIVGIPVGLQCFKFASLAFFPFGKEVVYGGGGFSLLVNILWLLLSGMEMALGYVILGCLWCVTIVGVPVGLQCFKMARLALMPFGASVV